MTDARSQAGDARSVRWARATTRKEPSGVLSEVKLVYINISLWQPDGCPTVPMPRRARVARAVVAQTRDSQTAISIAELVSPGGISLIAHPPRSLTPDTPV